MMKAFKIALFIVLLQACHSDTPSIQLDLNTAPYQLEEASEFVKMQIPADNPLTQAGVALGRQLFYDPILSVDSTRSCASCHQIQLGFTDGMKVSKGILDREGRRSAPSLINIGYHYKGLFWDGRAQNLEAQALVPIEDTLEFNHSWEGVEIKLQRHDRYPELFEKAFRIKELSAIDKALVAKALAQFERTLISHESKYDQVLRSELEFTAAEQRGWEIFFDASEDLPHSECGHCHIDPLFTDLEFHNNGIDSVKSLSDFKDAGRGAFSGNLYDNGKFKTPTLRNIALSAPYMHDGRFASLEEVIDHYISGGHLSINVNPNVRRLKLQEQDKKDLIAFLKTLTDSTFINNPQFGNPFVN